METDIIFSICAFQRNVTGPYSCFDVSSINALTFLILFELRISHMHLTLRAVTRSIAN